MTMRAESAMGKSDLTIISLHASASVLTKKGDFSKTLRGSVRCRTYRADEIRNG
jgi:hypothetical protein